MKMAVLTSFVLAVAFAHPCLGQSTETAESKLVVREVLPSATDRQIDKFSGDGWAHWVYRNPSAVEKNLLVVFLPGTGGKGGNAKAFCRLAADRGFHVVSLAYPSSISMSAFHNSSDPDAFLKARENIIYGNIPFGNLGVNEPNSIHNRLLKLVRYLASANAKENWSQFLDRNGSLEWTKLVLAGGSQGGGHAALLAMQHEVARVLMFGSPKDYNIHFQKPAKWFSEKNSTPLNRFFSFVHRADEGHGCTYPQQLENYRAMKLLPRYTVTNVDEAPAPYGHSRLLTSTRSQKSPHPSVISDKAYEGVWAYLLEEAVE
jgi:pimeloyl-ACP methyl ester carboxylesterase